MGCLSAQRARSTCVNGTACRPAPLLYAPVLACTPLFGVQCTAVLFQGCAVSFADSNAAACMQLCVVNNSAACVQSLDMLRGTTHARYTKLRNANAGWCRPCSMQQRHGGALDARTALMHRSAAAGRCQALNVRTLWHLQTVADNSHDGLLSALQLRRPVAWAQPWEFLRMRLGTHLTASDTLDTATSLSAERTGRHSQQVRHPTMRGRPGRRQALMGWPSSRNLRGVASIGVNAPLLSLSQQERG
jgi:hypothetical protein